MKNGDVYNGEKFKIIKHNDHYWIDLFGEETAYVFQLGDEGSVHGDELEYLVSGTRRDTE